jgi:hypothetical protein
MLKKQGAGSIHDPFPVVLVRGIESRDQEELNKKDR